MFKEDRELVAAVKVGDNVEVMRLGEEGASPDAKNSIGEPAVYLAACKGRAGAVSALVRLGADLDATDGIGTTALMEAAYWGKVECVRALLAGGADRTFRATGDTARGKTALEIAEKKYSGKTEVAALLRSPAEQAAFEQAALDGQLHDAARNGDAATLGHASGRQWGGLSLPAGSLALAPSA